MALDNCDTCVNYCFDEDCDGYVCLADMDEDDYMRFVSNRDKGCPFYRLDDEYKIVRKQN